VGDAVLVDQPEGADVLDVRQVPLVLDRVHPRRGRVRRERADGDQQARLVLGRVRVEPAGEDVDLGVHRALGAGDRRADPLAHDVGRHAAAEQLASVAVQPLEVVVQPAHPTVVDGHGGEVAVVDHRERA
jgi:hypothetical protein